jgi:uncharacterized protein involved in outer membrane biogenesis
MVMRRFIKISFLVIAFLLIATIGVAWYRVNDEAFLKTQLNGVVQKQTGRALLIEGPLRLDLGRLTTVEAQGIRFQNARWSDGPDMVAVGRLLISVDIPSLWGETPVIPEIAIEDCTISLHRNDQGQANWDVMPETTAEPEPELEPEPSARTGLPVELQDLQIKGCRLDFKTPEREHPLVIEADELSMQVQEPARVQARGEGSVDGEPLSFSGWYAPRGVFVLGGTLEHELQLSLGDVKLQSSGTVDEVETWAGANINAEFRGPEIETYLELFSLPPVSEGDFDFQFGLNTEGEMTRLNVDGDLGSLDILARGELDRLVKPQKGNVQFSAQGPNLDALGQAFGVNGLVSDGFQVEAQAAFEGTIIRISDAVAQTEQDSLELAGTINAANKLADSTLTLELDSQEIGRWAALLGQPARPIGAISLAGQLQTGTDGLISIVADLTHADSMLKARGTLGYLEGPIEPDLDIDFQSGNPRPLAELAGLTGLPAAAASVKGHVAVKGEKVELEAMKVSLEEHSVTVDGILNLTEQYAGSELDIALDIRNVASLGSLFGIAGLPGQPLQLSSFIKPEGPGLAFKVADGNLGTIQLELDGRIADLEKPLGIDASFDIQLPSLDDIAFLFPGTPLPNERFRASGRLRNETESTRLEQVSLELGQVKAAVDGKIYQDKRFQLGLRINGPDASVFEEITGQSIDPQPFSLASRIAGNPTEFELTEIDASYGKSVLEGQLKLGLGEVTRIRGALHSDFLDLSQWGTGDEPDKPEEPAVKSDYVFDDTPLLQIADYGVDIDVDLSVTSLDLGNTQFNDFELGLILNSNYLEVNPFSWGGSLGGRIAGHAVVDGRGTKPQLDVELHGRDLRLGILAAQDQDHSSTPPVELNVVMKGSGVTRREMASSLDGKIRFFQGEGFIDDAGISFFLSDFLTELIGVLNPFAETRDYTQLDCSVIAADIVSGQVAVEPVIIHTRQITITSQGKVDLDTESIDLSFNSKPREGLGLSAGALINPFIKVGGKLASPMIELDPKSTVVSGGVAVATVGLSILAKSMSDRFLSSKDPCGDARKEIEKREQD